jgi:hypothetical protein
LENASEISEPPSAVRRANLKTSLCGEGDGIGLQCQAASHERVNARLRKDRETVLPKDRSVAARFEIETAMFGRSSRRLETAQPMQSIRRTDLRLVELSNKTCLKFEIAAPFKPRAALVSHIGFEEIAYGFPNRNGRKRASYNAHRDVSSHPR